MSAKKTFFTFLIILAVLALSAPRLSTSAQAAKIKIAFVPGVVHPFYQTMQKGIEQAAADLVVEVVTQVPQKVERTLQTPIINSLAADNSINAQTTAATHSKQSH